MKHSCVSLQNGILSDSKKKAFVNECETQMEKRFDEAFDLIRRSPSDSFIALSGPTCSGKTTATKKLISRFQGKDKLIRQISLDDFYLDYDVLKARAADKGLSEVDCESASALDLDYLAKCLENIFAERSAKIPVFDFERRKRVGYRDFIPEKGDVILFEGIQAIYPEFTGFFTNRTLNRIHISVFSDLIYNGILFERREIRLMRRLVRDFYFRNSPPDLTFSMWNTVVENEDINIIPYEDSVPIHIDSLMPYEIHILAAPLKQILKQLETGSPYAGTAKKMLRKIRVFGSYPNEIVPADSLYREFIG